VCGDGVTAQVGTDTCNDASCTYSAPGDKSITLTAMKNGGQVGMAMRRVTLSAPPAAPPAGSTSPRAAGNARRTTRPCWRRLTYPTDISHGRVLKSPGPSGGAGALENRLAE
jgi:hypothetical protein